MDYHNGEGMYSDDDSQIIEITLAIGNSYEDCDDNINDICDDFVNDDGDVDDDEGEYIYDADDTDDNSDCDYMTTTM